MGSGDLLKEFNFNKEEELEVAISSTGGWSTAPTGFPAGGSTWRLMLEAFNQSMEETYFWMLNHLQTVGGYHKIDKITDVFAASAQSSFFGSAEQRLGIQQDKVSQFLATVGKMVRELFQVVREIRIIDERLSYYNDSFSRSRSSESAEITLKGIWIDQVEQGSKNPASVYGMSRELQFITLPDLFFSVHPQNATDVDQIVDSKVDFNRKVKEVLKRKLRSYLEWKKATHKELETRRIFTIKYLRQHYDIIHMYMSWVKPYLKNIKKLQMMDRSTSPDLISAFEGSLVEIELLAHKKPMKLEKNAPPKSNKIMNSVVLLTFSYRTRPSMSYQQEGYNKGPLHVGKSNIELRAYAWSDKQVESYKKMKDKEEMELLTNIDGSVKVAMEALGDELEKYLKEAGEEFQKIKEKKKEEKKSIIPDAAQPFVGVFSGFYELFGSFLPNIPKKDKDKPDEYLIQKEKAIANSEAKATAFQMYVFFKKDHGMLDWG